MINISRLAASQTRSMTSIILLVTALTAYFFFFGIGLQCVLAQNSDARVIVEEVSGYPGETVETAVLLENPSGMVGGELLISYDPGLIKPVGINRGELTGAIGGYIFLANEEYSPDSLKVAWAGLKGRSSDGTLAYITFELLAPGISPLIIEEIYLSDDNAVTISTDTAHGSITILAGEAQGKETPTRYIFVAIPVVVLLVLTLFFIYKRR